MDELIFLKAKGGSRGGEEEQIEVLSVLEREKKVLKSVSN